MNQMFRAFRGVTLCVWVSLTLITACSFSATANAADKNPSPPKSEFKKGFLFINGRYVSSPYSIELANQTLEINGVDYTAESFDLSGYKRDRSPGHGWGGEKIRGRRMRGRADGFFASEKATNRFGASPRDTVSPITMLYRDLIQLNLGAIMVLSDGRKPVQAWTHQDGYDFLKPLVDSSDADKTTIDAIEIPRTIYDEEDRETWLQLVSGFQATPAFLRDARPVIERFHEADENNAKQSSAFRWAEQLLYPLTTFALLLVVVAVGHLMAHAQRTFSETVDVDGSQEMGKVVVRSLVILALMSSIDLVWTLIAHQNGSMRELNPIGSRLISDPASLIAFKVGVTSLSVGLLYWLRDLPLTRKAAWWCCLVLTLLTARWLTFHSMLV